MEQAQIEELKERSETLDNIEKMIDKFLSMINEDMPIDKQLKADLGVGMKTLAVVAISAKTMDDYGKLRRAYQKVCKMNDHLIECMKFKGEEGLNTLEQLVNGIHIDCYNDAARSSELITRVGLIRITCKQYIIGSIKYLDTGWGLLIEALDGDKVFESPIQAKDEFDELTVSDEFQEMDESAKRSIVNATNMMLTLFELLHNGDVTEANEVRLVLNELLETLFNVKDGHTFYTATHGEFKDG